MEFHHRKQLLNLSYKLMTEATLKIDEIGLKATAVIPFCIMMLETTLKVLNQSKAHNPDFAKDNPEDLVDVAIEQVLRMFSMSFGKEIQEKKSKEDIKKEVNDFLSKNKLDWGENDKKTRS